MSARMDGARSLLDGLCRELTAQRDALDVQLRTLNATVLDASGGVSADLVLTLYLIVPSARNVAEMINGQGFRVPGATGPRALLPDDVFALVRGEPAVIAPCTDAALAELARDKLRRRGGWLP